MLPDLSDARWRKSSFSGGEGGECVEVTFVGATALLRDSKNPAAGVLPLGQLVAAVKTGAIRAADTR
jgi:hypothetical protein